MILPLLFALASGCMAWEIVPQQPAAQTIPALVENLRAQKIPYEVTGGRVLIWTTVPYWLDPIADSPEVKEIRRVSLTCAPAKKRRHK